MSEEGKSWKEISIGAVCWKPSIELLTGDWRTYTPVRDPAKCTRCLLCTIYCPDGAIHWKPERNDVEFDYNYCKGCGICANECPTKAIEMKLL